MFFRLWDQTPNFLLISFSTQAETLICDPCESMVLFIIRKEFQVTKYLRMREMIILALKEIPEIEKGNVIIAQLLPENSEVVEVSSLFFSSVLNALCDTDYLLPY